MGISERLRRLFTLAVLLIVDGCGGRGFQPAPAGLGDTPLRAVASERLGGSGSWMANGLKQRDLLYVSNANGTVNVYRYWQHTLVGVLTDFNDPHGECSDQAGNVYISDYDYDAYKGSVSEYAHGAKKPLHVIHDSNDPLGCSVDPKTGNLAVADYGRYYVAGEVAIYPGGRGTPTLLKTRGDDHFTSLAYDDRGDILATSLYGYEFYYTEFYYLPRHGTQLISIDLPGESSGWNYVQGIAWDGKYWVVVYGDGLIRFKINLKAEQVDSIKLSAPSYARPGAVAFYRRTKGLATQVVAPVNPSREQSAVEYWKYPAGGSPVDQITQDLDKPFGVAISLHP
jgi:hypothetical protein